jgi:hypothetical protein
MELSFLKYLSILHNKIDLVNIMWLNIVLPWGRWHEVPVVDIKFHIITSKSLF